MGIFDGKIIVSDLDGTFLGRDGRIVPENLAAIEHFQREGGRFTVATGREFFVVYPNIPQIEEICNFPAVACNGAYLYDYRAHRKVAEEFLRDELLTPFIRSVCAACPQTHFRVGMNDCFYAESLYDRLEWARSAFPERLRLMPLEDMPRGCWHKVAFDGPADEIDRARLMLEELGKDFACVKACPTIVEIQSSCGTKGSMIKRVKEMAGRNVQLYAVGDYENDYDMLALADHPAVPDNAIELLKRIPGVIRLCGHDQGAIADLIGKIEEGHA